MLVYTMWCAVRHKHFADPGAWHWWVWVVILTCQCLVIKGQFVCPKVCRCTWRDGKETVTCDNANYIDIPRGLDPSTQVLDLQHNNLKILPKDAFVDTGLVNLQKVWLTNCKLRQLHRGAFRLLANLVELDLSSNILKTVPSEALGDVAGLRVLRISRNGLNALSGSVFNPTPNLVRLDLSFNNISAIDDLAFKPLSRLEVLKLSGNKLTIISVNVLMPLVALHDFHVDANPWNCDCLLRPLRQWMIERNVAASIPPTCTLPIRLDGRKWHTLELDEFVCAPHVTAVAQRVLASDGDNVSLACRVRTEFGAAVKWLVGDKPLANTTEASDEKYKVLELVAPDHATRLSNLTIAGAALQDQGIYRCVAENKAGRAESNLTLQVSKKIIETRRVSPDQVFVAGALFGTLIFVLFAISLACLVYYRRRRRRLRHQNPIILNMDKDPGTPQLSSSRRSITPNDPQRKLVDYHIVPTSDIDNEHSLDDDKERTWMLRDSSVDDFAISKDLDSNNLYSKAKPNKINTITDERGPQRDASQPVSYVEIPKQSGINHSREQFEDPLLKDLAYQCKEAVMRRENTRPKSIQTSSTNSVHPFPDLLEFPRNQHHHADDTQINNRQAHQLSYCTIPRGPKGRRQTLSHIGSSGGESWGYPTESVDNYSSRSRAHTSFSLPGGDLFSLPTMESARSSSALNLSVMGTISYSSLMNRNPSLPNTPVLPRQAIQEFLAAHRPEYLVDDSLGAVGGTHPFNYEYHAAQLEHFLQEYKSLQDQLFRMKQSCDSARSEANPSTNNIQRGELLPDQSCLLSSEACHQDMSPSHCKAINKDKANTEPLKSILKNRRESSAAGRVQGSIGQGIISLADDPAQRLLQAAMSSKPDYYYKNS